MNIIEELKKEYSVLHSARSFFDLLKGEESDEEDEDLKLTSEEKEKFKRIVSDMHEDKRIKLRLKRQDMIKDVSGTRDEIRRDKGLIDKLIKEAEEEMGSLYKTKLKEIDLL